MRIGGPKGDVCMIILFLAVSVECRHSIEGQKVFRTQIDHYRPLHNL